MALPPMVQKQADEAEALAKKLAGEQEDPAQQVTQEEQGNGTQPVESQPKHEADFEQKYRTLQGIFNAETNKMRQQLAEQADQMKRLQEQLANERATHAPKVDFGTDEDRANFGSDFVELVERGVQARTVEYQKEIASLKSQVAQMNDQLRQVGRDAEVSRHAAYLADLDNICPNWRAQNNDKEFLAWLNEADPISGMVRKDILMRYDAEFNAQQVANIFKAFPGAAPKVQKKAAPTLAQQVSPTRGHSTQSASTKRNYTQAEITAFYDAWRRGMYTDEKGQAIEKDIELAYAEGRITA